MAGQCYPYNQQQSQCAQHHHNGLEQEIQQGAIEDILVYLFNRRNNGQFPHSLRTVKTGTVEFEGECLGNYPAFRVGAGTEFFAGGCDHPCIANKRHGTHVVQAIGYFAEIHHPQVGAHAAGDKVSGALLTALQFRFLAFEFANHLNTRCHQ